MTLSVRPLDAGEVETLVAWAAAEGWNPGLGDAEAFCAADSNGFLGAFAGSELVSGISAVAYGDEFGFIGLYITRLDHRGRGFGRAVWDAGMARLGGRTVGLDGVPEQQANYRAMGFSPAYRTIRYTGRLPAAALGQGGHLWSIARFEPSMRNEVAALDLRCFPARRDAFLDRWLAAPRQTLVAVADGRIDGYGCLRGCATGSKIGPLFARDMRAAWALLHALAGMSPGEIGIDVPERQRKFRDTLTSAGMAPGFITARMYRGPVPGISSKEAFGVTSLELG